MTQLHLQELAKMAGLERVRLHPISKSTWYYRRAVVVANRMNRPRLMSVVKKILFKYILSYPVPAVCKGTVDPVLKAQNLDRQITFGGVVLCSPTCFHLGRCSAVGEGKW